MIMYRHWSLLHRVTTAVQGSRYFFLLLTRKPSMVDQLILFLVPCGIWFGCLSCISDVTSVVLSGTSQCLWQIYLSSPLLLVTISSPSESEITDCVTGGDGTDLICVCTSKANHQS